MSSVNDNVQTLIQLFHKNTVGSWFCQGNAAHEPNFYYVLTNEN